MLPGRSKPLQLGDQIAMLDAAIAAAPEDKKRAGEDYVFLLMFEQRQGAICFAAAAFGALYGLSLRLVDRDGLHLVFGVIALLMMFANANQAGFPYFGNHPKVSINGRHVGFVFVPFWAVATGLNGMGFTYALS